MQYRGASDEAALWQARAYVRSWALYAFCSLGIIASQFLG